MPMCSKSLQSTTMNGMVSSLGVVDLLATPEMTEPVTIYIVPPEVLCVQYN